MSRRWIWVLALGLGLGCTRPEPLVKLADEGETPLFFRDVAVADVENGRVVSGRDVLVVGGAIQVIAETGTDVPPSARVIEGNGATLVPGLVEMHAHLGSGTAPPWTFALPDPERNLEAYLYCGVTTVLETAGTSHEAVPLREAVASGETLGPRIYTAGPVVTAPEGHPIPMFRLFAPWWIRWYLLPRAVFTVASPEDAGEQVRRLAELDVDVVKLIVDSIPPSAPKLAPDLARAVVERAHEKNLRVVVHIGSVDDAVTAGEAGADLWVHGVYRERIPDEAIPKLAAFDMPMVPTIWVFENYAVPVDEREFTKLERETVSAETLEAYRQRPDDYSAGELDEFRSVLSPLREAWRDNVRRLHEAGVTMLVGSDTQTSVFPGAGVHREIGLLLEAGLTPAEILRAATISAARFLEQRDDPSFGVVAAGKRADLVLVDGDPFREPRVLSEGIREVVLGGRLLVRRPVTAD